MNSDTEDLVFQCKDILSRDVRDGTDNDSTDSGASDGRVYQIVLFGTTATGASVTLFVSGFKPFFYVRLPDCLKDSSEAHALFRQWVMNGVPDHAAYATSIVYEQHKTLFDYNAGAYGTFAKITVPSQAVWRHLKDRFLSKTCIPNPYEVRSLFGEKALATLLTAPRNDDIHSLSSDCKHIALKVYEANIDPFLRWFHIQDVSPSGWVCAPAGQWIETEAGDAQTTISAVIDWDCVKPGPAAAVAPFLVASWDIECNSSHGDFPIAKKTWRKPLRELFEVPTVNTLAELGAALVEAERAESVYLQSPFGNRNFAQLLESAPKRQQLQQSLTAMNGATSKTRDDLLTRLDELVTEVLPPVAGDEIIQIGTVLYKLGAPVSKHIWVLGTCNRDAVKPPGADVPIAVYVFETEAAMLKAWIKWLGKTSPDVLVGYNIFGFDSKYIYDRLEVALQPGKQKGMSFELKKALAPLSCLRSKPPRLEEKFLSSSAMGDNTMYFIGSAGRLQIDLLPYIRRNHNLDSYKLDNVSATFVSGGLKDLVCIDGGETYRFKTKSTKGIVVGRYLTLMDEENDRVVEKCAVVGVEATALIVTIEGGAATLADHGVAPVRWAQVKDDVSPKDIFRLHRGSADDRAIIARYCLQDCDLVMELFHKLEVLNNSIAMASVCSVPVGFIFLRGQGIKAESLIFKECRKVDQLIEVMSAPARNFGGDKEAEEVETAEGTEEEEGSYEGAIVLEPHTGIYLDDPVTADDFASLYPSSIISENISHDTLIWVKDYTDSGEFVKLREGSDRYDNLPGAKYVNIEFDILRIDPADTRKNPTKFRDGRRVARYIQQPQGTIPRILEMLLSSRKKTRKMAEAEPDEFRKALLDAQQLAYKLTANSLYGQLGSGTFKIRRQVLAASTTAYGRKQLLYAKEVIERLYGGGADPRCDVECVYGDTDSIFLRFRPKDPATGKRLTGQAALQAAKDLTIESGKLVSSCLKAPHDFEFDKIFRSFILLSKKRYVGDMSEDGLEPSDFHRKSMGIVMKRRDNAPIVKYVYGGAIDRILGTSDVQTGVQEAAAFVSSAAKDLLAGKFGLHKLTITKSLRAEYADPLRIAHKVLADRIAERDPGNKPSTSDRIPYVYISSGTGPTPTLQGDRIELPSFIVEHKLTPDYAFYITNQIAKPVSQVFGLAIEAFCKPLDVAAAVKAKDPVAAREACAEAALFKKVLVDAARTPEAMAAKGQRSLSAMFKQSK